MSHKDVIKKKSSMSLMISAVVVIAGFAVLFFTTSKILDVIGSLMMFTGVLSLIFAKKVYIYSPTGSKITAKHYFFNLGDRALLTEILESGKFTILKDIPKRETGLKMDFFVSKNNEFAAAQLSEYIPYKYVEITRVYEYFGDTAHNFAKSI